MLKDKPVLIKLSRIKDLYNIDKAEIIDDKFPTNLYSIGNGDKIAIFTNDIISVRNYCQILLYRYSTDMYYIATVHEDEYLIDALLSDIWYVI